jgi:hypothetical protein
VVANIARTITVATSIINAAIPTIDDGRYSPTLDFSELKTYTLYIQHGVEFKNLFIYKH